MDFFAQRGTKFQLSLSEIVTEKLSTVSHLIALNELQVDSWEEQGRVTGKWM